MSAEGENNLSGRLGLDTTDFKTGVNELRNQVKNIETSFRASAVTMEDWGNTSNGLKERANSLREELARQKQEMELYRQELVKVSSGSEGSQKAADSLTNKMYSLQKQISYNEKDFQKYSEQLKNVEKSEKENSTVTGQLGKAFSDLAERSKKSTSNISSHFGNLKSSITGYIAGIISAVSLKEIADDTGEAEKNLAQMDAVLKSTGDASGMTKEQLVDLAEAEGKVTTFSAETTEKAENMLLTFTGIGKGVFPQTVQATLDMATAMHMDATQAAETLGKALNDPAAGLTKLTKQGVTFTDAQKQQIVAMQKSGNVAGAQTMIIKELGREFGNSAKAAGQVLPGQIQIMENSVKSSGMQITASLLPIAANTMPSLVKSAQGLAAEVTSHKTQIIGAVNGASTVVKSTFGFVESHGPLVKGSIIGIVAAVGLWKAAVLAANVVQAVNNAMTVTAAINENGLAGGEAALAAAKGSTTLATMAMSAATIKDTAQNIAHAIAQKASTAATNAAKDSQILFNAVLNANPIGLVITAIAALVGALVVLYNKNEAFRNFVNNMWAGIKGGWMNVINGIKGAWSSLNPIEWGKDLINGIANGIRSAADHVKQAVGNVATTIRSFLHFSRPDTGDLRDYESWMPDFMSGLARGIDTNKYKVVSAMRNLAMEMSISPTMQPAFAGGYSGTQMIDNSVTRAPVININGPVNVQSKGSQNATLQQLQFLTEV